MNLNKTFLFWSKLKQQKIQAWDSSKDYGQEKIPHFKLEYDNNDIADNNNHNYNNNGNGIELRWRNPRKRQTF